MVRTLHQIQQKFYLQAACLHSWKVTELDRAARCNEHGQCAEALLAGARRHAAAKSAQFYLNAITATIIVLLQSHQADAHRGRVQDTEDPADAENDKGL